MGLVVCDVATERAADHRTRLRRRIAGRHPHRLAHLFRLLPRLWVRLQTDWDLHQAGRPGRGSSEGLMALQQEFLAPRPQEPKTQRLGTFINDTRLSY